MIGSAVDVFHDIGHGLAEVNPSVFAACLTVVTTVVLFIFARRSDRNTERRNSEELLKAEQRNSEELLKAEQRNRLEILATEKRNAEYAHAAWLREQKTTAYRRQVMALVDIIAEGPTATLGEDGKRRLKELILADSELGLVAPKNLSREFNQRSRLIHKAADRLSGMDPRTDHNFHMVHGLMVEIEQAMVDALQEDLAIPATEGNLPYLAQAEIDMLTNFFRQQDEWEQEDREAAAAAAGEGDDPKNQPNDGTSSEEGV